jgi:O-methyltransferase involved in polyketide biosynthesis
MVEINVVLGLWMGLSAICATLVLIANARASAADERDRILLRRAYAQTRWTLRFHPSDTRLRARAAAFAAAYAELQGEDEPYYIGTS